VSGGGDYYYDAELFLDDFTALWSNHPRHPAACSTRMLSFSLNGSISHG